MKKVFWILLICVMLALCACSPKSEPMQRPENYYYCNTGPKYEIGESLFAVEVRETAQFSSLETVLQNYLIGPVSENLTSPFPKEIRILSAKIDEFGLKLEISDHLAQLQGVNLTSACYCLAKTAMDMTGEETVRIYCDTPMEEFGNEIVLNARDFVLADQYPFQSSDAWFGTQP